MHYEQNATVACLFTEYGVARGLLKFQCKTWELLGPSFSVYIQAISVIIHTSWYFLILEVKCRPVIGSGDGAG